MSENEHIPIRYGVYFRFLSAGLGLALATFSCSVREANPIPITASFTYTPASPVVSQAVQFTDTSTGSPTSWRWQFGDGMTSSAENPNHAYTSVSSYNVTLTVSNGSGSNNVSKIVNVLPASTLIASFTYSPTSPAAGQPIQFTDTSTGKPTSWLWDFGDGTTSTARNPSHTYASAAAYSVALTIGAASNSNSTSRAVTVRQPGVIMAASPSFTDVSAAIASAIAGDTVRVPAGMATWGSQLFIKKGIYLIGAGIGVTVITSGYGGSYLVRYDPSDYNSNDPFRLSGFTFDLNGVSGWLALGGPDKRAPFTVQTKIRIDHNRIIKPKPTMSAQFIWNYCNMYGVVDNNSMEGGWYFFKSDPQGTECGWWNTSPQNIFLSGSDNYLYFEDNTFAMTGTDNILSESQYSGRYAFRYNTITGAASYSLFELHGHQTSGAMGSCFGAEVYGNQITAGSFDLVLFKTRGGSSFVFYNNVTGSGDFSNSAYTSLVTCAPCQPLDQMVHDTYWFQNMKNLTGAVIADAISGNISCAGLTGIPMPGRDVISNATTPGVTCGPLASRPATCQVHQGYWATDQSITDLTGMVGINPATPISGTLYICTSTNVWTPFYTPYSYPHPLRTLLSGQDVSEK